MLWDPDHYLRFADHRARPGVELMARIPEIDARTIVDLGCGTGGLTALLAQRWPTADVIGIDSSVEMVEWARRDRPDMTWIGGGRRDLGARAGDRPDLHQCDTPLAR